MAETTKISWADHTGNPWVGCTVAHTGCTNCYARDFSQKKHGKVRGPWALWGPGQDRLVTKGFWTDAPKWARAAARDGVRRTIFPSLMDPLDAEVYQRSEAPEGVACRATFDRFMQTIRDTGRVFGPGIPGIVGGLTWLLLTKRPENWRWIPEDVRRFCWLLYSASDQPSLDAGMPHLLAAEGFAGLGLSLEPLVGPINTRGVTRIAWQCSGCCNYFSDPHRDVCPTCGKRGYWTGSHRFNPPGKQRGSAIRWCIIGGESGRNARPCDVAWIRDIVRQCREAGVVPYVKQLGKRRLYGPAVLVEGEDAAADPAEWPEDLRVQEFPEGLR